MPRIPSGYRMVFFDDALRSGVEGIRSHYRLLSSLSSRGDCRILLVEEPVRIVTWFRGRRLSRVAGVMSFAHNCGDEGWPILEDAWAEFSEPLFGYCAGHAPWPEVFELGLPQDGGCVVEEAEPPHMASGCRIVKVPGSIKTVRGMTSSENPLDPAVQGLVGVEVEAAVSSVEVPRIWIRLLSVGQATLLARIPHSWTYILLGDILDDEYSKLLRYNLVATVCRRDRCAAEC